MSGWGPPPYPPAHSGRLPGGTCVAGCSGSGMGVRIPAAARESWLLSSRSPWDGRCRRGSSRRRRDGPGQRFRAPVPTCVINLLDFRDPSTDRPLRSPQRIHGGSMLTRSRTAMVLVAALALAGLVVLSGGGAAGADPKRDELSDVQRSLDGVRSELAGAR